MNFQVISVMGDCLRQSLSHGVVGRAFEKNTLNLELINPRQFTEDVHQTIDDRPYGGGDGMVMMAEPLKRALESLRSGDKGKVFMLSPQGALWTDAMARDVAENESSVGFICGRYAGVDERFLQHFEIEEISVGDYVLSGGELACAVVIDSISRKIPGVLGHSQSAIEDSFGEDSLLEAPQFTRPREWMGLEVPSILLEGHHEKIQDYRRKVSWLVTLQKRPELIVKTPPKALKLRIFLQNLSASECESLGLNPVELLQQMEKRSW